jgi:hypothetical protein
MNGNSTPGSLFGNPILDAEAIRDLSAAVKDHGPFETRDFRGS